MRRSVSAEVVVSKIHFIRGQKVLLDVDLAKLYEVETKYLIRQVKRNTIRFPQDFMFQLTEEEFLGLRSQIATSNKVSTSKRLRCQNVTSKRGGRRYLPYVFTENGVAMLSSVLNSPRAIAVNILIMRTFTRLRELLVAHKDLALKVENLERDSRDHGRKIHAILNAIKELLSPPPAKPKPRIGFHP